MESSRRFSLILIPILAFGLFLFRACKSENTVANQEALSHTADSLQEQVKTAWVSLLQADDQMQYNLNTLVQAYMVEGVIDSGQYDSLQVAVHALGPLRREMETMGSEAIDSYDDTWISLSGHLIALPGDEPVSTQAQGLIMGLDEFYHTELLGLRTQYDQAARMYNAWYDEHGKKLSGSELPARYPLFSISE